LISSIQSLLLKTYITKLSYSKKLIIILKQISKKFNKFNLQLFTKYKANKAFLLKFIVLADISKYLGFFKILATKPRE